MEDGKRCAKCGESKPLSEFAPGKKWKDGLHPYCRECKRAADKASYAKHAERRRTENRARYAANPLPQRERAKRQYASNSAAKIAYTRSWQSANAEKVKRYKAKWVSDNLAGAVRENTRRRYARRKGAPTVKFTAVQLAQKVAYWGDRCWLCNGPHEAIDHVKPLAKGGAHMLANLRPICMSCNAKKRDVWPYPTAS